MTRFITKKDGRGRSRHIPIRETRYRNVTKLHSDTFSVKPDKKGKTSTGDEEYTDYAKTPDMILNHVRKFVLEKRLVISPNKAEEEINAYDAEGGYRTIRQLRVHGGSFDYIIGTPDGEKKYMVNGRIRKKKSGWSLSGIGAWM